MSDNAIMRAVREATSIEPAKRKRGRPTLSPRDVAIRKLRVEHFGSLMRKMRLDAGLTLIDASKSLDEPGSPRRLQQYEGACFPPGNAIHQISEIYGVDVNMLARTILRHSQPEIFEVLFDEPAYMPDELDIKRELKKQKRPR